MTEPYVQALMIQADQTYEIRQIDDRPSTYKQLIGNIDRTFEVANMTIWCSSEPNLPFNPMATFLWWKLEPAVAELVRLDGTVIVTGRPDEAGDATDLPTDILETYRDLEGARLIEQLKM
ncbi:MAG: hypothetical protein WCE30_19755 [Mycobacterium sp.]